MAAQRGDDVGDGLTRVALVDPVALRGKLTRRRLRRVGQRGFDTLADDRGGERLERGVRDVMVGEAQRDGVGPGERGSGQRGVQAQQSRARGTADRFRRRRE